MLHPNSCFLFLILLITIPCCMPFSHQSQFESEKQVLLKLKQQWHTSPFVKSWHPSIPPCKWLGIRCTNDSVTGISLPDQGIGGKIPSAICDLTNLAFLNLSYNFIPGGFPTVLYNCSKLHTLDLWSNNFEGLLPNDIYKLSNLQYLDIGINNFKGDIPGAIGQLTRLTYLQLYNNKFDGTFPIEIGNLVNLETLSMGHNPFVSRMIPKEFGRLKKLNHLRMWGCNLIDYIPHSFANFSSLTELDLAINNLVGGIPSGLFQLKNLTSLHLFENQLSGEIPSTIEAFNLVDIELDDNNLTGSLPKDFRMLQKLQIMYLFNNQLSGPIPALIKGHLLQLNEKIDIYSFGVVLLELSTGKEPRRANDHLNLADWSQQYYREGSPIEDALDIHIKEPQFLQEMMNVFKLGVMCTRVIPSSRPSMKQVLELLISFNHRESSNDTTSTENGEERDVITFVSMESHVLA